MTVSNLDGENGHDVDALVDTGSRFTMLPADILHGIGARVLRDGQFEMADGRVIEMTVGAATITLNGVSAPTQVIFGPEGCQPLLGAMTLQELELVIDMPNERLRREPGPFRV